VKITDFFPIFSRTLHHGLKIFTDFGMLTLYKKKYIGKKKNS
jgi:hypothetical protein